MPDNTDNTGNGGNGGGSGDGYEDPKPPRPIIFMSYAVGTAAIFFIIDMICKWWQQLVG